MLRRRRGPGLETIRPGFPARSNHCEVRHPQSRAGLLSRCIFLRFSCILVARLSYHDVRCPMSRLLVVAVACSVLFVQNSPSMAAQKQTSAALKCASDARARARLCASHQRDALKEYECGLRGAQLFRKCCDNTPDPQACKSQVSQ
jgi:hypothetical protein